MPSGVAVKVSTTPSDQSANRLKPAARDNAEIARCEIIKAIVVPIKSGLGSHRRMSLAAAGMWATRCSVGRWASPTRGPPGRRALCLPEKSSVSSVLDA